MAFFKFKKTYGIEVIDTLKASPFLTDDNSDFENSEKIQNLWFVTKKTAKFPKELTSFKISLYSTKLLLWSYRPDLLYI